MHNGTVDTMTYAYDALQRLTSQTVQRSTELTLAKEYSYKNLSGGRTTQQISGFTVSAGDTILDSYTYTYDSLGNITAINRNGNRTGYAYDAQNQLTAVSEDNISYGYTYDTYGNILSAVKYDDEELVMLSSNTYSYNDPQWIDRLTAFNGHAITYDEIGNPLTYYNGNDYAFTWSGRELATATKGNTTFVSYEYGADGLRTQKTVGGTVYNYYYADGLLIRQTWGTNYMDFLYDESGSAYSFIYNGAQYYYVKNLQGDVVKILNDSGNLVASYFYDAWGKVTSSGNIVGLYNPIRYRGYYYDTDTGFYYLQSRYYDPTVKRFISADTIISGVGGEILGYNQYAYCMNNPVNMSDSTGNWPNWSTVLKATAITVATVAIVAAAVATIVTFGGASIATTIVLPAAISIVSCLGEVAVLQGKKSMNDGKGIEQVTTDIIDSMFDNGMYKIAKTSATKTVGYITGFYSQSQSFLNVMELQKMDGYNLTALFGTTTHEIKNRFTDLRGCASANASKKSRCIAYAFAAYDVVNLAISIFSDDPVHRATRRGYTLK